jgi:hypothetical protein
VQVVNLGAGFDTAWFQRATDRAGVSPAPDDPPSHRVAGPVASNAPAGLLWVDVDYPQVCCCLHQCGQ